MISDQSSEKGTISSLINMNINIINRTMFSCKIYHPLITLKCALSRPMFGKCSKICLAQWFVSVVHLHSFLFFRVGDILNVTREIDNFFPGMFDYYNVRLWDSESSELMKHWDDTYKFIHNAK